MPWETWTIVVLMPLVCLLGIALTIVTLPGTWLIVLAAAGAAAWQPGLISWWTIAGLVCLAALGEALEFLAGAMGAAKAGASKHGAIGALAGTLVGALIGLPFAPPFGTIIGGALGAASGAILAERAWLKRTWKDSAKAGVGAAIGRLAATLLKGLVAVVMALVVCVALVW